MKSAALTQPSVQSHRGPTRGGDGRSACAAASTATTPKSTPEYRSANPRSILETSRCSSQSPGDQPSPAESVEHRQQHHDEVRGQEARQQPGAGARADGEACAGEALDDQRSVRRPGRHGDGPSGGGRLVRYVSGPMATPFSYDPRPNSAAGRADAPGLLGNAGCTAHPRVPSASSAFGLEACSARGGFVASTARKLADERKRWGTTSEYANRGPPWTPCTSGWIV